MSCPRFGSVAATNRDLEAESRAGRFRADLYYRLNVVHLELPPLRARPEDVALLVDHFVQRYSRQYQVAPKRISAEAMERLRTYAWPGNVRQLQNAIERAFALSVADTITVDDLPPALREHVPIDELPGDRLPTLEEAERHLFAAALRQSGGNKNEAARLLGIDRQRL